MSSIKENVYKRISKAKKRKPKKKDIEQRFKPYPMDYLRNKKKQVRLNNQYFRSFEKAVIKPCSNNLQVELSKKLNKANSDKLISWQRLKASLLASAQKVALYPTLLTMNETEVLADRENARLTLYKDGTAIKSYRLLVGDTFKMI